jgi:sugar O-acyltransferase (sialic acid O-acetyltransferase NeuD family)
MGEPTPFVFWDSAGHAKVLASLVALRGGTVIALFDRKDVASSLQGVPMHVGQEGFDQWVAAQADVSKICALVAIGGARGRDRIALQQMLVQRGLRVVNVVHPSASVCHTAEIGAGTQILAHAVVAAQARIGQACIVNHRASVDHECVLGDGVHVAPGATLCGCVEVGDNVLVGAGAVVLPRVKIGADAVIGAGAVVTRDVPGGTTVAGNPARKI